MTWLPPVTTAEPASEPVTLAEAKAQCRVDGADEDARLNSYITAARQLAEEFTGTRFVSQTAVLRASCFADLCHLPLAPVSAVTGITYLDGAGDEQTLATSVYESVLIGLEPTIRLKINQSWPNIRTATDAVRVTVTAGYSTVPEPIRHAILLTVCEWFDDRSQGALPAGAVALLTNYRR